MTFYIPDGGQVVDAVYMMPDVNGALNLSPIKGQSIMAVGAGSVGANSTAELAGFIPPGVNGLGITAQIADSIGSHQGTLAGVYADTGIFYSTSPETAWQSNTTLMKSNSGDEMTPNNRWDYEQMRAYGDGAGPVIDPNGRGNAPWGMASGVAGPESGYAWSFDIDTCNSPDCGQTAMQNAVEMGPWQRIQYPGSQIANDVPGSLSAELGYAGLDASTMGHDLSSSNPLPQMLSQTDNSSPNAIRWSVGALVNERPEYVWVKLRLHDVSNILGADGCPTFYADTFGGDPST